jgi:2-keto-4-pentenoate hydratase/2-oxohepta-3-ene-1,7-dioic acid hydratase in catechol pathway
LVQANGTVALSSLAADLPKTLDDIVRGGPALFTRIAELAKAGGGTPVDRAAVKILAPFRAPGKIICIGLNYGEHAKETKLAPTQFPTVFARYTSTLVHPGDPILVPKVSNDVDYEVELTAVIGKRAHYVAKADALDYIVGYTVANDVSIRDYQMRTSQFTPGKNFDATCPLGPDFVTADELPAGGKGLRIETRVNGEVLQSDTTDNMLFDVATLVEKLSEVMTLEPGDIILTGTPSGVGYTRKPPIFLKHGDACEVSVERVGVLTNPVVNEPA